VLLFSVQRLFETFFVVVNILRVKIKNLTCCPILVAIGIYRRILLKLSSIKFYGNASGGSHIHIQTGKINRRIFAHFLCERAKSTTSSSLCLCSDTCLVIFNTRNMEHVQLWENDTRFLNYVASNMLVQASRPVSAFASGLRVSCNENPAYSKSDSYSRQLWEC